MTGLPPPRRNIELLTAIKTVDADGAVRTRCFGNILELGCESLILESSHEQRTGEMVTLSLVFPGPRRESNRVASLRCVVRRIRDRAELLYDLVIEEMDEAARRQLIAYLSQPGSQEES